MQEQRRNAVLRTNHSLHGRLHSAVLGRLLRHLQQNGGKRRALLPPKDTVSQQWACCRTARSETTHRAQCTAAALRRSDVARGDAGGEGHWGARGRLTTYAHGVASVSSAERVSGATRARTRLQVHAICALQSGVVGGNAENAPYDQARRTTIRERSFLVRLRVCVSRQAAPGRNGALTLSVERVDCASAVRCSLQPTHTSHRRWRASPWLAGLARLLRLLLGWRAVPRERLPDLGLCCELWALTPLCFRAGERAEGQEDLLQEVQEARGAQGDAVQDGQGEPVRPGCVSRPPGWPQTHARTHHVARRARHKGWRLRLRTRCVASGRQPGLQNAKP